MMALFKHLKNDMNWTVQYFWNKTHQSKANKSYTVLVILTFSYIPIIIKWQPIKGL